MTLDELLLIKVKLAMVPRCFTQEQKETCQSCKDTDKVIKIVNREIKLKTMDPRRESVDD